MPVCHNDEAYKVNCSEVVHVSVVYIFFPSKEERGGLLCTYSTQGTSSTGVTLMTGFGLLGLAKAALTVGVWQFTPDPGAWDLLADRDPYPQRGENDQKPTMCCWERKQPCACTQHSWEQQHNTAAEHAMHCAHTQCNCGGRHICIHHPWSSLSACLKYCAHYYFLVKWRHTVCVHPHGSGFFFKDCQFSHKSCVEFTMTLSKTHLVDICWRLNLPGCQ